MKWEFTRGKYGVHADIWCSSDGRWGSLRGNMELKVWKNRSLIDSFGLETFSNNFWGLDKRKHKKNRKFFVSNSFNQIIPWWPVKRDRHGSRIERRPRIPPNKVANSPFELFSHPWSENKNPNFGFNTFLFDYFWSGINWKSHPSLRAAAVCSNRHEKASIRTQSAIWERGKMLPSKLKLLTEEWTSWLFLSWATIVTLLIVTHINFWQKKWVLIGEQSRESILSQFTWTNDVKIGKTFSRMFTLLVSTGLGWLICCDELFGL